MAEVCALLCVILVFGKKFEPVFEKCSQLKFFENLSEMSEVEGLTVKCEFNFGARSFLVAAPTVLWNSLPADIRACTRFFYPSAENLLF